MPLYSLIIIVSIGYLIMKKNLIITLLASAICVLLVANYCIYYISESSTEAAKQEAPKEVVAPKPDNEKKTHVNSIDAKQLSSDDAVQNALKNAQIAANELRRLENRKRTLEKINAEKKAKEDYYRSFAKAYETDIYDIIPYDESVFKDHQYKGGPQISERWFEHVVVVNSQISASDFKSMSKHTFNVSYDNTKTNSDFSIQLPYYKFGGEYTSMTASNCYLPDRSGVVNCFAESDVLRIYPDDTTPEVDFYLKIGEDYQADSRGRPETFYLFKDNEILMYNLLDANFERRRYEYKEEDMPD